MGGEKGESQTTALSREGSPPHGRGKVEQRTTTTEGQRITPAWAGKRASPVFLTCVPGDHPRMGGEKYIIIPARSRAGGSPPHGRGKVMNPSKTGVSPGITPAWAGKSRDNGVWAFGPEDHPRMGGEKEIVDITEWPTNRITPAWAGKSIGGTDAHKCLGDHPRMGGEK